MNLIFETGGFFELRSLQVQEIERGKAEDFKWQT